MLYTLNLYRAMCQLHLNKTGRKINKNVQKRIIMIAAIKTGTYCAPGTILSALNEFRRVSLTITIGNRSYQNALLQMKETPEVQFPFQSHTANTWQNGFRAFISHYVTPTYWQHLTQLIAPSSLKHFLHLAFRTLCFPDFSSYPPSLSFPVSLAVPPCWVS